MSADASVRYRHHANEEVVAPSHGMCGNIGVGGPTERAGNKKGAEQIAESRDARRLYRRLSPHELQRADAAPDDPSLPSYVTLAFVGGLASTLVVRGVRPGHRPLMPRVQNKSTTHCSRRDRKNCLKSVTPWHRHLAPGV